MWNKYQLLETADKHIAITLKKAAPALLERPFLIPLPSPPMRLRPWNTPALTILA